MSLSLFLHSFLIFSISSSLHIPCLPFSHPPSFPLFIPFSFLSFPSLFYMFFLSVLLICVLSAFLPFPSLHLFCYLFFLPSIVLLHPPILRMLSLQHLSSTLLPIVLPSYLPYSVPPSPSIFYVFPLRHFSAPPGKSGGEDN